MKLAASAWDAVTSKTIQNCWKHVRLVPDYSCPLTPPLPNQSIYNPTCDTPPLPFLGVAIPDNMHYTEPLQPTPQLMWHEHMQDLKEFHPEIQQAIGEFDLNLLTEHEWMEQEIVDQLLAERTGNFVEEENVLDLVGLY